MNVAITQVYKPGGFTNVAGTPNFLTALDGTPGELGGTQVVQWTDIQVGGLQKATIQMVRPLESNLDLVGGNWLYFALGGGTLNAGIAAGASSLTVDGLGTQAAPGAVQSDILTGDWVLISDGVNTDLMQVSSVTQVSGSTYTIGLAAAPGQNTATTLNAYGFGSTVARLQFSGYLYRREPTSKLTNKFVLECYGFGTRYNNVLVNADIVQQDAATSMLNICQSYAPTLPQIIVNPSNFATANGIMVTTNAKNGKVFKIVTDILKAENSHDANTNYAFWVDAARQAHHAIVPGANVGTPTGALGYAGSTPATPTFTIDIVAGSTYGDMLGPIDVQDMDVSKMVNTAIVNGGTKKDKTSLSIIVQDTTSQAAWGYYEGEWNNPDLVDDTAASLWGAGQLCLTAYPLTTAKTTLVNASMRFDSRALLEVTGFTDGSIMQFNPTQVQYTWDARKQVVTGSIDLAQARPDIGAIMAEGMREVSQRHLIENVVPQLGTSYVVSGFDLTFSGLTVNIAAGRISYNGAIVDIPAYSYTFSGSANGAVEFGAQVGGIAPAGVTLPSIVPLPSVTGISTLYAHAVYSIARPPLDGGAPITITLEQQFEGCDLYRVTAQNGVITGDTDQRNLGGISNNNLQPPTGASPTVASPNITLAAEGAASAVATVEFTVNGVVPDGSYSSIDLVYSLHGANQWHPGMSIARDLVSLTSPVIGYVHGLAAQQAYDFAFDVRGLNGAVLSGGPYLIGSVTASQIAAAIATWNEFGGTTNADGSWSNVDGHSTSTQYSISGSQPVIIAGEIQRGATTSFGQLLLGNQTNGYGIGIDDSGDVFLAKYVAGTYTNLGAVLGAFNDTEPHSYRLTISNSGGTNNIEGTIDQHALAATDTSLALTSGTWPVTVYTGGNTGKLSHYAFAASPSPFGGLPGRVGPLFIPPWENLPADNIPFASGVITARHILGNSSTDTSNVTQDKIADGATYARVKGTELVTGTVKQLNDGTNVRTAAQVGGVITSSGELDVSPAAGVINNLPQANHDPAVLTGSVTGIVKNLVPDSEFMFGLGNGYWHTASAISISPQDGGGSGNMAYYQQGSTAGSAGYQDFISAQMYLQSGLTYNLSGYINATNVTAGGAIWGIYDPTVSTQYASVAQTAGASGRVNVNFTVPTTGYYVLIGDTSGVDVAANGLIVWSEPQITYSIYPLAYRANIGTTAWNQNYWPYAIHAPAVTNTLDVNGNLKSSTTMNNIASTPPSAGLNVTPSYTCPTSTELQYSVPSYTYYRADGSSYTTPATTSTVFGGLTSGTVYYTNITYDNVTGVVSFSTPQSTIPAPSQYVSALLDHITAIYIAYQATPTTGGSGGATAPGLPSKGCPGTQQLIETRERGFVKAGTLEIGEHLRDPFDGWNRIESISIEPTILWEIETASNVVRSVREVGFGNFAAITCEHHRYVLPPKAIVNDTHRVMLESGAWRFVRDLRCGDQIMPLDGAMSGQIGHNLSS